MQSGFGTQGVGLIVVCLALASAASAAEARTSSSSPIPAFARKYRTSCSTCHAAAPKLNVLGEAFRLNGYRFPQNDALLRREEQIPLGAEPWKELWPRAIWPGELTSVPPVSLRVVSDIRATRDASAASSLSYMFPHEIYGLAGGSLGGSIGFFVEAEWEPDDGLEILQAKVPFQDPLPFLSDRSLNIWVGLQNLYVLTLTDRQIDRTARQRMQWSEFAASDVVLVNRTTGDTLQSLNDMELRFTQAAIELNGIVGRRAFYAFGLSQGTTDLAEDNNDRKDFYYKLRYKFGGLALDGTYDSGGAPVVGTGGQLFDRSVIIETFGYFGAFPVQNAVEDDYRRLGIAARWLYGSLDLGLGFVWGKNDNPWGLTPAVELVSANLFFRAQYFFFPWFIGSLKADDLDTSIPEEIRSAGFTEGALRRSRILPGIVMLIRQNLRAVLEAELFIEDSPSELSGDARPDNLWLRLDFAF